MYTVEPACVLLNWDLKKCPDYQGVMIFQVILYDKVHAVWDFS